MPTATLPALPRLSSIDGASRRRPEHLLLIAGAHAALVWLFLQADVVARAAHPVPPMVVALRTDPAPPPLPEPWLPKPIRHQPPPLALMPLPEVQVAPTAAPGPPAAAAVAALLPPAPLVAQTTTAPANHAPVQAATAPSAPSQPTALPASAIRYRVPPALAVPMASRRLGEAGTVLLRVWVDAHGQPRQVSLHRSSGFARLDEQALAAMRQARFQPITEGGNAIEWVVIAPLQYEID